MGRTTPRNNLCPAAMCEHDCSRCTYTLKPPAPLMGYGGPLSDIDKIHPPQFQAPLPEEVYDLRHGCAVPVEPDDPRDERIAELEAQVTSQARRLAEVEVERDKLRECHCAELGVCYQHCDEAQGAVFRAEAAEAKLRRIEEWARDNCGTCGTDTGSYACMECRCGYDLEDYPQAATYQNNWTPPKEWGE